MGVRRDRAPVSRAGQLSLAPQTRSPANNGVVLRGTESLLTLCWREMDSNYWSRHGEPPLGRAPYGFRARLHQLGEALIPRGTKSSNPSPSSGESIANSIWAKAACR